MAVYSTDSFTLFFLLYGCVFFKFGSDWTLLYFISNTCIYLFFSIGLNWQYYRVDMLKSKFRADLRQTLEHDLACVLSFKIESTTNFYDQIGFMSTSLLLCS